jgi:hypothetical protein
VVAAVVASAAMVAGADDAGPMIVPDLASRLAALGPGRPMAYFELAEEVGAEAMDERGRGLARRLYVLAHELDRGLGPSVYLALAALADSEEDRRWLLALAGRAEGIGAARAGEANAASRLLLAEAIGRARAGESHEVKELLAKEGVRRLVEGAGSAGRRVLPILERAQAAGLCVGCRGRRTVRTALPQAEGEREEVLTLCSVCRGNPGPGLSAEEFARTLAVEADLVGAEAEQWGAQAWLDGGAPVREADPDSVAARFGVEPGEVYWIAAESGDPLDGRWARERGR